MWSVNTPEAIQPIALSFLITHITSPGAQVQAFVYVNTGGPFPAGSLTQIASSAVYISSVSSGVDMVTLPLIPTGLANPGDELVVLFNYPDNGPAGPSYRLGFGEGPGTQSFIKSSQCEVFSPVSTANLGFPNELILMMTVITENNEVPHLVNGRFCA